MTRLSLYEQRLYAFGLALGRNVYRTLMRRHPVLRAARLTERPVRGGSLPNVTFSDEGWSV